MGLFVGACALLGACLFPSFDGMLAPAEDAQRQGRTSKDAGRRDSEVDEGELADAVVDGGGPTASLVASSSVPAVIACRGSTCAAGASYCCVAWGGAECEPAADIPFCEATLRCDDRSDCGAGQVCCLEAFIGRESSCRSSCGDGKILCAPGSSDCPGGQSCTGTFDQGNGVKTAFCQ